MQKACWGSEKAGGGYSELKVKKLFKSSRETSRVVCLRTRSPWPWKCSCPSWAVWLLPTPLLTPWALAPSPVDPKPAGFTHSDPSSEFLAHGRNLGKPMWLPHQAQSPVYTHCLLIKETQARTLNAWGQEIVGHVGMWGHCAPSLQNETELDPKSCPPSGLWNIVARGPWLPCQSLLFIWLAHGKYWSLFKKSNNHMLNTDMPDGYAPIYGWFPWMVVSMRSFKTFASMH